MTKNKYFSSSRKKTPWDDAVAPSCLQSFIRDEYKDHFYMHHISLEESNEDKLVNSYMPSKCPYCLSTSIKKNGKTRNNIQRYKCLLCNKTFTVLTNTIFDNHKLPISEWIEFLLNLFSNSSINLTSKVNKNAATTTKFWLKKLFLLLEDYQDNIVLDGSVYLDEMFYSVIQSEIQTKDNKQYRGLSRNKYCIGVACNENTVACFVEGKAKTSSIKTLKFFKDHIKPNSVLKHDGEKSHNILIKELDLKEEFYKATTPNKVKDEDNPLRKVNHHCANIRDFLEAHHGFNRDELQDYLNLYSFKYNTKGTNLEKVEKILELSLNSNKTITFREYYSK